MISSRCCCFYSEEFCQRFTKLIDKLHNNSLSLHACYLLVVFSDGLIDLGFCDKMFQTLLSPASLAMILCCESVKFVISDCFLFGTGHCLGV